MQQRDQEHNLPVAWQPGEHVAVIGDTGTGKTYLISKLVQLRDHVVVFRTKPDDINFPGFTKKKLADSVDNVFSNHILLVPDYSYQAREGYKLLEKVWKQGGWTIVIDELWYVERLGLRPFVERLMTQGRSKGISVVAGFQRPAQISRFSISQCTHLFSFRTEGRDSKIIRDATTPAIIEAMNELHGHDFVYYNRPKRMVEIGNANELDSFFLRRSKSLTPAEKGAH